MIIKGPCQDHLTLTLPVFCTTSQSEVLSAELYYFPIDLARRLGMSRRGWDMPSREERPLLMRVVIISPNELFIYLRVSPLP
jgi:hypothetical protein